MLKALIGAVALMTLSTAVYAQTGLADEGQGILDALGLDFLNVSPGILLALAILYKVAQIAAKVIPNDATGVLGGIRKISKVASGYVNNRKTAQDSVS